MSPLCALSPARAFSFLRAVKVDGTPLRETSPAKAHMLPLEAAALLRALEANPTLGPI